MTRRAYRIRAFQALRRSDQTKAEMLVIKAARPTIAAASKTIIIRLQAESQLLTYLVMNRKEAIVILWLSSVS